MLIRKLDEVKTVEWGNGLSRRFLLDADGMGYTMTDTIVRAGTKSLIEYENHLEACYCIAGSGMVVDTGGFFLNDRMRYFYLDPADVNSLQPGKRVRQTINPAMALKDGKPWIAFGTPGSDTQPQTQLQFFLNVAEFGLNVQDALEQPAVISNSFRDSYQPHAVLGKLLTPAMLPKAVRDELAAKGHQLDVRDMKGVGSVKAILIDPRTGVLMGGVSPAGDSYVMAW